MFSLSAVLAPAPLQAARTEVALASQAPDFQNKTFLLHLPAQPRGSDAPAGSHPVPALQCRLLALPLQESLPRPLTPGGTEQQDLLAEGVVKLAGRSRLQPLPTHTMSSLALMVLTQHACRTWETSECSVACRDT